MKNKLIVLIVVMALLSILSIKAQTVISGVVTSVTDGKPIEATMVRLINNNKIIAFCTADKTGHYMIRTQSKEPMLIITFERMSFTKKTLTISNINQTLNVALDEDAVGLKEVTVKAPSVRQIGDTLLFNVADFVSKGDLTLEDALKKIPGIEINSSGQILYMSKSISKFYIEGLDMLGGKYTIATKNIPKDYVQSVEVLNHNKDKKIDKDNISNDVAINIKLSKKAKLKPIGTSAVSIGYGDKLLYQLEAMGMLFTPKFQSLITTKYGNVKQFSMKETNDFFNSTTLSVPASSVQGALGGSRPPLAVDRYVNSDDGMLSANFLKKINDDATMKANVTYGYDKTDYDYGIENKYYDPKSDGYIVVNEQNTPGSITHKPMLEMEYKNNSKTKYFSNDLHLIGNFTQNTLFTNRTDDVLNQKKKADMLEIRNNFNDIFYWGKNKWSFLSTIAFTTAPTADMTIKSKTGKWNAIQDGKANKFRTSESVSTTFKWGRLTLLLPISANYVYDDSRVNMTRQDKSYLNHVYSNDLKLSSNISMQYKTPNDRFEFSTYTDLDGIIYNQKNSATGLSLNTSRFYVNPSVIITYNISALSSIVLIGRKSTTVGDVANLFNAPVLINYRTEQMNSGIVNKSVLYNANIVYNFTSIPKLIWFDASATYNHYSNNVMNESNVDESMMTIAQRLAPSSSENFLTTASVTKEFKNVGTKIMLKGYYRWINSEAIRNDYGIRYKTRNFGFQPNLNIHPVKWLELNYNGDIIKVLNDYSDKKINYLSQEHTVKLKYYPIEAITISTDWDYIRKPISDSQYKNMSLLDLGASYLYKRVRYAVKMNNTFNTRHYSYNSVSGFDSYSYDFNLRGREIVFSISFTQ